MSIEKIEEKGIASFFSKHGRKFVYAIAAAVHIIVILTITINNELKKEEKKDNTIFKMVDIQEYTPPPKEEKKEEPKEEPKQEKEDVVEVTQQDAIAEDVIETEKEVKEVEIEYLPQHKITEIPVFPTDLIKSKVIYPPLAAKQEIEGSVILEVSIDQNGNIRGITVLKDPGYGFAQAALKAMEGIKVIPARANGVPVAVKYRYPIRFALTK
ncbi:MAG: hypothetical protein A2086_10550 [Spirochaetes bacterium GWD1_27_9]|nr:MAG: hypothetical protein A2Z98_17785 [Spirochaetes bacterium GWB1_27_13]OHD21226.1 MAG: hypothetical protein A2Y34_08535 [Spirochaetes bacterium GWC1_27_15]OHD30916.1 MAG: hypothetical protein A2086_10550 [Spirochaetes bacterium GWD1_27_9]